MFRNVTDTVVFAGTCAHGSMLTLGCVLVALDGHDRADLNSDVTSALSRLDAALVETYLTDWNML